MKAKIFYLTMTLVMVLSLMVVPAVVAEEVDPPYAYIPSTADVSLSPGATSDPFLTIDISWGGVKPGDTWWVKTKLIVDPDPDPLNFVFTPSPFTLNQSNPAQTVRVTVPEGTAEDVYVYKIKADMVSKSPGNWAIGQGPGCTVTITVEAPPPTEEYDSGIAVVVFENPQGTRETTATTTETTTCGAIPSGYTAVGSPVDITTTVIYGAVVAGVRYDDSQVDNEANLRLFHCYGGQW